MMADVIRSGLAWLAAMQRAKHSQPIVYQRDVQTVSLAATIGRTEFEAIDEQGVVTRHVSRDFIVTAADLVLGGSPVLPQRGDRIRETVGSQTFVHEVLAPGNELPWRWSDPYRERLRIHTKQVATE